MDSIFEAQNICFGSEIVSLLDHSYNKCALKGSKKFKFWAQIKRLPISFYDQRFTS